MKPRSRQLSDPDRAAWHAYIRHVQALPGRESAQEPEAAAKPAPAAHHAPPPQTRAAARPAPALLPPALVTGLQPPGLDNGTWGRFRTGKLAPARTLDLHGKTAQSAYHALEHFLLKAHAEGLRCVEIITGRGAGEQGGVIRRELPLWLNLPRLRGLVLATAHPHAKNTGSTRILLRRARG